MPAALLIPEALSTAKKLPVVGGVVSEVTSVFEASDPGHDADRNRKTDAAYAKALTGDVNAIAYVWARGGLMDILKPNIPGYGLTLGWGSDVAKKYARQKYDALKAMPNLAAPLAQADALLRGNATPVTSVGDALTRNVGAVGLPVWMIVALVAGALALAWAFLRRR